MGITLANMVPEKRAAIMTRAWLNTATNRVGGGDPLPFRISRWAASARSVISQQLSQQQDFQRAVPASTRRAAPGAGFTRGE